MATVLAGFTMSLDGFIAHPDDSTEGLFDWFDGGDTEVVLPNVIGQAFDELSGA